MPKEDPTIFYVELQGATQVRRALLETVKELLHNLKDFEHIKEIRKQKLTQVNNLAKIMKDLNKSMGELKKYFPESQLKKLQAAVPPKVKIVPVKQKKKAQAQQPAKQQVKKPMTEIEKLEAELADIESKLHVLK